MVQRFGINDGTDGIVERKVFRARERLKAPSQGVRGEGACGDYYKTGRGNFAQLFPAYGDEWVLGERLSDGGRESLSVNCQCPATWNRALTSTLQQERPGAAQLFLQQPRSGARGVRLQ